MKKAAANSATAKLDVENYKPETAFETIMCKGMLTFATYLEAMGQELLLLQDTAGSTLRMVSKRQRAVAVS